MTSNLGSQYINERGLAWPEIQRRVMDAVRTSFRPELLNRIDEVVIFRPLERQHIQQIVEIQLRDIRQRLEERKITLHLTEAAKEQLAGEGFDPVYGARPLRRAIQLHIVQPLALQLLEGKFHDGEAIVVDVDHGQFVFHEQEAGTPMAPQQGLPLGV
jgi:ATP-dependent Clp protease ATP-binding subunit ClpB